MTMQEPDLQPATASSPYLSLRRAVQPAIFAHRLMAGDQERAGRLAAECEELLLLTRELLKATGHVQILAAAPEPRHDTPDEGGDRQAHLLEAYADAAMGWAKVVGSLMALAGTLLDRGDHDDVRRLADVLQQAGENNAAADLRIQLGKAVWDTHYEPLRQVTNEMPPAEIRKCIAALRAVLREVPEDFPDRDREVNRFLAPLAASVHAIMKDNDIEITYDSRVEHIATGGVARYPEIVKISLDELSAEFEGICQTGERA
jgi:hypothetical protein